MNTVNNNGLKIDQALFDFINKEAIPGTGIDINEFCKKFADAVNELSPINKRLLEKREEIQKKIDDWHKSRIGKDLLGSRQSIEAHPSGDITE